MIGANVSAFSIGKAVGRGGGASLIPMSYGLLAGAGGGGYTIGGGGGAGGMLDNTAQVEVGTAYQLTVGAGGAGAVSGSAYAPNGSNSIFGSFDTAIGGGSG
jgi:hypothetical protein